RCGSARTTGTDSRKPRRGTVIEIRAKVTSRTATASRWDYAEHRNRTMHISIRHFTRLAGDPKSAENQMRATNVHYMCYNVGRTHQSMRVSPVGLIMSDGEVIRRLTGLAEL